MPSWDLSQTAKRDAVAAKHFLQMAMWRVSGIRPRVINVDGHAAYPQAIRRSQIREERMAASLWFRSIDGALRTIAGYEAMNVIRKGQIRWLARSDIVGPVHYIERIFGLAT